MTSIVFPGQGSQTVGMVKDFYNNFKKAKLIFEEIEDHTKIDLKDIIFENVNDKNRALLIALANSFCFFLETPVILLGTILPFSVKYLDKSLMSL